MKRYTIKEWRKKPYKGRRYITPDYSDLPLEVQPAPLLEEMTIGGITDSTALQRRVRGPFAPAKDSLFARLASMRHAGAGSIVSVPAYVLPAEPVDYAPIRTAQVSRKRSRLPDADADYDRAAMAALFEAARLRRQTRATDEIERDKYSIDGVKDYCWSGYHAIRYKRLQRVPPRSVLIYVARWLDCTTEEINAILATARYLPLEG